MLADNPSVTVYPAGTLNPEAVNGQVPTFRTVYVRLTVTPGVVLPKSV
jgi:hypothetical protein